MICLFEYGLFTLVANRTHLSRRKTICIDYLSNRPQVSMGLSAYNS